MCVYARRPGCIAFRIPHPRIPSASAKATARSAEALRATADIPHPAIILAVIVARRFFIGGRVQGVGFRFFAEEAAAREGVHGYIRNLADGRVEALVEGDQEAVDRVEMALRRGPSGARIETFEVEPATAAYRATGFTIR
jgi:acylphosphatase